MLPAAEVESGSVVVVPLAPPADNEALDFTFVARTKAMFITIFETPQSRNTYGHVASYSTGSEDKPFPMGTLVMFATPNRFIVAKWRLIYAIRDSEGAKEQKWICRRIHRYWRWGSEFAVRLLGARLAKMQKRDQKVRT